MSVQDYYDQYWTEHGFLPTGKPNPPFQSILARQIGPQTDALDLGCGDGRTNGLWLKDSAKSYAGVDISGPAVASAIDLGLDARVISDASELPFPDDSFDVVVCAEVLEHLFSPQDALAEVKRVLRPGGIMIASVPNSAYWRRRADLALIGRWNPMGDDLSTTQPWRDPHIRFFTTWALRCMYESAGWTVEELGGQGGTITGDIPVLRRLVRPFGWQHPNWRPHPIFGRLESRFPGLFGYRLFVVARAPS